MATQSFNTLSLSTLKCLWAYCMANKIMVGLALYFAVVVLVYGFWGVDIGIPCLWKALTGWQCIGCGLTTACLKLFHLDFAGAYQANFLVFIVIPFGVFYFAKDLIAFKAKFLDNPF